MQGVWLCQVPWISCVEVKGGGEGEGGVCWSCKRYLVSKGRGDYDGRPWAQIPSMFNTYDRYPESTVSKCAMRPENLTI